MAGCSGPSEDVLTLVSKSVEDLRHVMQLPPEAYIAPAWLHQAPCNTLPYFSHGLQAKRKYQEWCHGAAAGIQGNDALQ